MKKALYIIFACIFPLGIYAQKDSSDSNYINKIDSLTQVVNELSTKIQKVENGNRNEDIWGKRKKHFYIGYMNQTLTHQDIQGLEWKSDYGVSMGLGRTYYLHKNPIFRILKFGLDVTWYDISYAKYSQPKNLDKPSEPSGFEEGTEDLGIHQLEAGLKIGPSITLNPVGHLKVNGYFHFIPSCSMVILNDEANTSYVSNFAVGAAISYKAISLGMETRWGKAKYNSFAVNEETDYENTEGDYTVDDVFVKGKNKLKTKSLRFFLTFRY